MTALIIVLSCMAGLILWFTAGTLVLILNTHLSPDTYSGYDGGTRIWCLILWPVFLLWAIVLITYNVLNNIYITNTKGTDSRRVLSYTEQQFEAEVEKRANQKFVEESIADAEEEIPQLVGHI